MFLRIIIHSKENFVRFAYQKGKRNGNNGKSPCVCKLFRFTGIQKYFLTNALTISLKSCIMKVPNKTE